MKKINFLKGMLVVAILFIANLTVFAGNPGDNLIYNAEEVNGVVVSETIFKMEGTMLTNYMKHNYKYDANNQRTEDEAQKWNSNKNRWEKSQRFFHVVTDSEALLSRFQRRRWRRAPQKSQSSSPPRHRHYPKCCG